MLHAQGVLTLLTPLLVLATALAWTLAQGWLTRAQWPFYRPIAWLLTLGLVADQIRALVKGLVLEPARVAYGVPYAWPERWLFHVEQAGVLAWPAAILGTGLVIFLRRSPWPVVAAWALACIVLAIAYPELRGERLAAVYAAASVGCCVVLWIIALKHRSRNAWVQQHVSLMLLSLGEFASNGAYVLGDHVRDWSAARAAHATALGLLVCYITAQIWQYSRWRRS